MSLGDLAQAFAILPIVLDGEIFQYQQVVADVLLFEADALHGHQARSAAFDEPFAVLDPHLRRQMEEQLRETLAGYNGAAVFAAHEMDEAFRFCGDLLVLDLGKVIASGPKRQLFERPQRVAAAPLTGCKNIVPARRTAADRITVDSWNCELQTAKPVPDGLTHVGLRSHQTAFHPAEGKNIFFCWLMGTSEVPHEMTLYLRLHAAPALGELPHLQADVPGDLWRMLNSEPQPWRIEIDPERLLLLQG